jgi:hypothetical protein
VTRQRIATRPVALAPTALLMCGRGTETCGALVATIKHHVAVLARQEGTKTPPDSLSANDVLEASTAHPRVRRTQARVLSAQRASGAAILARTASTTAGTVQQASTSHRQGMMPHQTAGLATQAGLRLRGPPSALAARLDNTPVVVIMQVPFVDTIVIGKTATATK